jgi:hypothetical protein
LNRPGNIANIPNVGTRPGGGGAPSRNELQNFLDLPGSGGGMSGLGGRPTTRPDTGDLLAGGAAGQFLHDNPTPFPSRPGVGDLASNRPTTLPGTDGLRPGGGEGLRPGGGEGLRPGGENRPLRPGDNTKPIRPGQGGSGEQWKPGDWANHRPDQITDRKQWSDWRTNHRDDVWNHWRDHAGDYGNWYNRDWWDHHHVYYPYYPNFNYWAWAAWGGLSDWVDYGSSQPIYYNYGDNVYYDDTSVYYGDQPVATTAEYAQQAAAIATSVPEAKPAAEDWMPLGVFAITTDGKPTDADPTMYLQLAVSKQGVLSGTLQNTLTDTAQSIEGMVDKQSQRAAWTVAGKTTPIMETGISNLTQDTAPALVHFADGSTQQWLLVRLEKPKDAAAAETK